MPRRLHEVVDVGEFIDFHSTGTADGLHWLEYGAAAEDDGFDGALGAEEIGEGGACGAADAVLEEDDLLVLERLRTDIARRLVASDVDS